MTLCLISAPPPDSSGKDPATKDDQDGLLLRKSDTERELQAEKKIATKTGLWVDVAQEKKSFEEIQSRHHKYGR